MYMAGVTPLRTLIALAALAIGMLALATMRWRGKPKQPAEKGEKAEIMRRLLALSESENGLAVKAPSARLQMPPSRQARRTSNALLKTRAQTSLPIRSKTN